MSSFGRATGNPVGASFQLLVIMNGPRSTGVSSLTLLRSNVTTRFCSSQGFYGRDADGKLACSIITRKPADQIAHIHHRMPVIMSPEQIQEWLTYTMDQEQAQNELGAGWEGRFEYHRVAPINSG